MHTFFLSLSNEQENLFASFRRSLFTLCLIWCIQFIYMAYVYLFLLLHQNVVTVINRFLHMSTELFFFFGILISIKTRLQVLSDIFIEPSPNMVPVPQKVSSLLSLSLSITVRAENSLSRTFFFLYACMCVCVCGLRAIKTHRPRCSS